MIKFNGVVGYIQIVCGLIIARMSGHAYAHTLTINMKCASPNVLLTVLYLCHRKVVYHLWLDMHYLTRIDGDVM